MKIKNDKTAEKVTKKKRIKSIKSTLLIRERILKVLKVYIRIYDNLLIRILSYDDCFK